jgi:hypothetical protein
MSELKAIETPGDQQPDLREVVRQTIQEFVQAEQHKAEPAYKAELHEERKRRESLESRLNQLVEENRKARAMADEADRNAQIRAELQRLGVAKLELAFRAVKDDIVRAEDGRLQVRGPEGKTLQEHLASFVQENPELLPARIPGGSGAPQPTRTAPQPVPAGIELENIRPGMTKDESERVRQEIARLASQMLRGI